MDSLNVSAALSGLKANIVARGYATLTIWPEAARDDLARLRLALAGLHAPDECEESRAYIETRPSEDARCDEPFNRPEAIGWHNDFSTHARRPSLTLAYVERADPHGPGHGAWRVAPCDRVLERLSATSDGRGVARFLAETPLPYSFTGEGEPSFFRALQRRAFPPGRFGFRFYGRAMRDGARLLHGVVPDEIEHAIQAVETAADEVGIVLPALTGSLLVTDNWHCLHDRLAQTVESAQPLRRSLLCFVEAMHEGDGSFDHSVPTETPPHGSSIGRAG
jgi:hypothetical protein